MLVIHLAPILRAQEAFPANGALKVLKTSSSFDHIFYVRACVRVSVRNERLGLWMARNGGN